MAAMDKEDLKALADAIVTGMRGGNTRLGDVPTDPLKFKKYLEDLNKTIDKNRVTMGGFTKEILTGKQKYHDLSDNIEQLDEQIEELGKTVDKNTDESYRQLIAKRQEMVEAQRNITVMRTAIGGIKEASKTMGTVAATIARGAQTVAKDVMNNSDIFTTVADAMDIGLDTHNQVMQGVASTGKMAAGALMTLGRGGMVAGAALYGISEILSTYTTLQTETQKFYNRFVLGEGSKLIQAFQKSSSSGAMFSNGMQGISDAAIKSGLTIKQFSDVVARNGENLAKSGMGVGEGADMMAKSMANLDRDGGKARKQLLNLGYTFEEQADLYAETMGDMRRANDPRIRDEAAIHQVTMQYAENLRTITAITGEDAKKKMEESRQLAAQAAFRIKLQELEQKQPGITQKVMMAMETMTPTMKNAVMQQIGLGAVVDKNANIMMAMSPEFSKAVSGTVGSMERGQFSLEENQKLQGQTNDQMRNNLGVYKQIGQAGLAGVGGTVGDFNKALSEQIVNSDKVTADSVAAAQQRTKNQKDTQDKLTGTVIDAVKAGQSMAVELEALAREELPKFRDAINETIKFIRDKLRDAGGLAKNNLTPKPLQGVGKDTKDVGFWTAVGGGALFGLGTILDFTGIGAAAGVPLQSAGASMITGGVGTMAAGSLLDAIGFADGGISTGPTTGHLELLHGKEAVIPLPDGNSIPVNFGGGMDELVGKIDQLAKAMETVNFGGNMGELTGKIDQLARAMGTDMTSKAIGLTNGADITKLFGDMQEMMGQQLDASRELVDHSRSTRDLTDKLLKVSM